MGAGRLSSLVVLVAVATALTGCAAEPPHPPRMPVLTSDDSVDFAVGMGSMNPSARFEINSHGCIVMGSEVIVGRRGSRVAADGVTFTLAHVGTFRIGAPVPQHFGGVEYSDESRLPAATLGCGAGDYVVVT